ncbi:MAG: hypothetical protein HRU35_01090 [Rickettsiaceae bacterium]|nr:hypothetical protein [Rickettsiaceae bacterium]
MQKKIYFLAFIIIAIVSLTIFAKIKSSQRLNYWERKYVKYYNRIQEKTGEKYTKYLPSPAPDQLLEVDFDKVDAKLKSLPNWMTQEIEQKFSKYENFSTQHVLKSYNLATNQDNFTLFTIKNGVVTHENKFEVTRGDFLFVISFYEKIFAYLSRKGYIKNLSFVLLIDDAISGDYSHVSTTNIAPILVFSRNDNKHLDKDTVLVPDWFSLMGWVYNIVKIEKANKEFPWEKKLEIVFWRGGNADISGYRHGLVELSAKLKHQKIDVQFSHGAEATTGYVQVEDHIKYKYQISIDGLTSTWDRVVWQLYSNCVMLKQRSDLVQWFYSAIKPGKHYVDVGTNPDELLSILSSYSDDELKEIAENGQKFAKENLMPEDMMVYLIAVLQKYETLQNSK